MGKFCTKCGSPIPDGEICPCQKQSQPINTDSQIANAQEQKVIQQSPNDVMNYLKQLWTLIIQIFKAPVSVGIKFTKACDSKKAFGLIGAQALSVALLFISLAGKINGVIGIGGSLTESVKVPLFKVFLVSAAVTFGMACLMSAVIIMFIKLFKGQTTYKHMLCLSGTSSIMTTPFILLALLISLMTPINISISSLSDSMSLISPFIIPLIVALISYMLSQLVALKVMKGVVNISEDNSVYVLFLTEIVMIIAFYFVMKIALPMCK